MTIGGLGYMQAVCVADMNNDGKPDVVAMSDRNFTVLSGDGAGGFSATNTYGNGYIFSSLAVRDVNNDGFKDAILIDSSLGTLNVFLNTNGGFAAPLVQPVPSGYGSALAVGDFDRDGRADYAVTSLDGVAVLFGDGYGGLLAAGTSYKVSGNPTAPVAVDLDGDGYQDLILCNIATNTVTVLRGLSGGVFAPPVYYPVGGPPRSLVVGDFNDDHRLDLATANGPSNTVSVLLQRADGSLAPAVDYPTRYALWSLAAGDLNGDGKLDLVGADGQSETVTVLLGKGDGTFINAGSFLDGGPPNAIAVADLNGDGQQDVIAVNYDSDFSVSLLFNETQVALNLLPEGDSVKVTWPAYAIGAVLESSSTLSSGDWQAVTNTVVPEGSQNATTLPLTQDKMFFRLKLN